MARIRILTQIRAPVEICFDLARSVELHVASASGTDERAVSGVTRGLLVLGDEVTWEATHFGVRQRLRVRITEYAPPHRFTDEMTEGVFRRLRHVHEFEASDGGTRMTDSFEYEAPLGVLGRLAEILLLQRHLTRFLLRRNAVLRSRAEEIAAREAAR